MNKAKYIIAALLVLMSFTSKAKNNIDLSQDNRANDNYFNEINARAGIYVNTKGSNVLNNGTMYSAEYTKYSFNGIGGAAGVSYVDNMSDNISLISVPVKFVYNTRLNQASTDEKIAYAARNLIENQNIVGSALSFLDFNVELNAGVSPGYILEERHSPIIENFNDGIDVDKKFFASLDLGCKLSLRIYRIYFITYMQYHYIPTQNFSVDQTYGSSKYNSFASIEFGLAHKF